MHFPAKLESKIDLLIVIRTFFCHKSDAYGVAKLKYFHRVMKQSFAYMEPIVTCKHEDRMKYPRIIAALRDPNKAFANSAGMEFCY